MPVPQKNMSIEEFLKLIESASRDMYGSDDTIHSNTGYDDPHGLYAEAQIRKERMERKNLTSDKFAGDLTEAMMPAIKEGVKKGGNLRMGNFIIKVKDFKMGADGYETATVDIHEERKSGSMIIPQRVVVLKDNRFRDRPWLKYFEKNIAGGKNIPLKTAAEVVRWCQAINRIGAFF